MTPAALSIRVVGRHCVAAGVSAVHRRLVFSQWCPRKIISGVSQDGRAAPENQRLCAMRVRRLADFPYVLVWLTLKGFKNLFLTHLKPKYRLLDDHFIPLVSVIEEAVQIVGDEITHDLQRREASPSITRNCRRRCDPPREWLDLKRGIKAPIIFFRSRPKSLPPTDTHLIV
jgi:hypothetical protein